MALKSLVMNDLSMVDKNPHRRFVLDNGKRFGKIKAE